uniref:ELF3 homologue n=1 Tax=Lemna aequinoctialis TaxID=89585 RepID=Q50K78_LEMAE|nr:ELF3 homologue [Lemna aequinoctialis]
MKRGREEEKISSPLFPRLHVNDADKGGPRAPPRNKMALYEQFSIPSQRFTSSSSPSMPFPSHRGSNSVPSISSSQGCVQERSASSSLYMRSQIPHSLTTEKSQASTTESMPRVTSTVRQSPAEKSDEDFRVPVYVQSSNRDGHVADCKTRSFKKSDRIHEDLSSTVTLQDASSGQDHDDDNLRSSGDAEKSGSSGSTEKIDSSGDDAADRMVRDDASERLLVDSREAADAYNPDNLVGLIGLKHFWKARRAIISQQRVLALQVFELHRLMNIQKLLAESPQLLLEDASSFHGSPAAPSKSQPVDTSVKPIDPTVNATQPADRKEVLAPEEETRGGEVVPPALPAGPAMSDGKSGPLPIQVAGNHWLFPVMSPTEGLIYKPFYKPENMVLLPPPYCVSQPVSGSAVDQGSFFSGSHASNCNRPNPREADLQSSTASSAASWPKPGTGATVAASAGESPTKVIKVMPRNPKSASESAVKIFQSIQMERKRFDPL